MYYDCKKKTVDFKLDHISGIACIKRVSDCIFRLHLDQIFYQENMGIL